MEGRPLLQTPGVITCSVAFHVTQRSASNIDDVAEAVGGDVSVSGRASGRASGRGLGRGRGSGRGRVRARARASRSGEGSDSDGRGGG